MRHVILHITISVSPPHPPPPTLLPPPPHPPHAPSSSSSYHYSCSSSYSSSYSSNFYPSTPGQFFNKLANSSGNCSFRYWIINIPSLVIRVNQFKLNHSKERFFTHLSIVGIVIKWLIKLINQLINWLIKQFINQSIN